MSWERIAASFCLMVGLSLIVGFVSQFRERLYVAWLGLCFLTLAYSAYVSQTNIPTRNIGLAIAGVFFLFSAVSAVQQTRRQLAAIRRRQDGMVEQMMAILEIERERHLKGEQQQTEAGDENHPLS